MHVFYFKITVLGAFEPLPRSLLLFFPPRRLLVCFVHAVDASIGEIEFIFDG